MKVAVIFLYLLMGVFAKNVFDFNNLKGSLENEQHEKRDAKNLRELDDIKIGVPVKKRDPKYAIDLSKAKIGVPLHIQPHEERDEGNEVLQKRDAKNIFDFSKLKGKISKRDQEVMMNEPSTTLLQTMLPQYRDISIFAGYIRDNKDLDSMTNSLGSSMLVICPTDDAITTKLNGKKPWEFPTSLETGNEDEVVESNLNYFISNHVSIDLTEAHIEDEVLEVSLLSGKKVKIVNGESVKVLVDNREIKVSVSKQVDNGLILIIDDVLVKPN